MARAQSALYGRWQMARSLHSLYGGHLVLPIPYKASAASGLSSEAGYKATVGSELFAEGEIV